AAVVREDQPEPVQETPGEPMAEPKPPKPPMATQPEAATAGGAASAPPPQAVPEAPPAKAPAAAPPKATAPEPEPPEDTYPANINVEAMTVNMARLMEEGRRAFTAYLMPRDSMNRTGFADEVTDAVRTLGQVAEYWYADPQRTVEMQARL